MVAAERPAPSRAWLEWGERLALPAILLLAFALRLYRLGDKNVWWDEGLAIWAVRKGLLGVTLWTAQDVHPPLYFWHLWAWVRLVGESEFAARAISACWGVLTVALAYPLGTRLGGRRVGLAAALLLAISRFHIWWSQEMRMYVLAALAATLTLYLAVRWLDEERAGARCMLWPVAYALGAAACLYTIYLAGLAPLVANGYAALALARVPRPCRWGAVARWLAAQVAALLAIVPWLLVALPRMHSWSKAEPLGYRAFVNLYASLLALGISTDVQRYSWLLVPFAAVLAGGAATLWWRRRGEPGLPGGQAAVLLALALGVLPLAVYLLTRPRSLFYTPRVEARYLVLFAPLFCLGLAWSAVRLGRRSLVLGLGALAACLGPMLATLPGYYAGRYLRDELQSMVRVLGAYTRPGDVALLISGDRYPLFDYYLGRIVAPARRLRVLELPREDRFTDENVGQELEAAIGGRGRFWVASVEAGIQDPSGLALPWLDAHFQRVLTYDVGYNALILYGDPDEPLLAERARVAPQVPLQASAGGVELLGYDLPGREYAAGDTVDLGLYWASDAPALAEVEWLRDDDGERLGAVTQDWPATGPAAGRAAARFRLWPWYRGGGTHFVVRWGGAGELRLPGPRILEEPGRPRPERIAQPLEATFGPGIRLLGYDLHREVRAGVAGARAGDELVLDLFWEATQPLIQDYTVFTQVLGQGPNPKTGGPLWGQHDGPPVGGAYPTGAWAPGQVIADRHVLIIDGAAPGGEYELIVGLYLPQTGERLPVRRADGMAGDHLLLAQLEVRR